MSERQTTTLSSYAAAPPPPPSPSTPCLGAAGSESHITHHVLPVFSAALLAEYSRVCTNHPCSTLSETLGCATGR